MIVLGIDPGAKETGMVLVDISRGRTELLWHSTIRRERYTSALPVPDTYLNAIGDAAAAHTAEVIGVEDITAPNPHMECAFYQSAHVLATGTVAGWCRGTLRARGYLTVSVPPKGNGSAVLGAYPIELVSKRERARPGWRYTPGGEGATLRHERSAFDVARTASRIALARKVKRPA